jgi:alpha-methylacyl-CoA racemase
MVAREAFVERDGVVQPAPAPRFSHTPSTIREPAAANIVDIINAWGAKPSG